MFNSIPHKVCSIPHKTIWKKPILLMYLNSETATIRTNRRNNSRVNSPYSDNHSPKGYVNSTKK